ncbi:MAG: 4Fe-4S ferredoxin [Desulfobacteraceae bacterium]|nr:4Fe-4S ferredoxin [Desulfobacteraceae bacterium]
MPGMIKNVLKNFISKSATRPYPIEVRPGFKDARGELTNQMSKCTLCTLCAKKCPTQCITVLRKELTWEVDPFTCVYCGICVDVCPQNCLSHSTEHKKPARTKTKLILKQEKPPAPEEIIKTDEKPVVPEKIDPGHDYH